MKECDLYEPIRRLLSSQGFIVRGEVKGCDIAAVNGDILWVVEMKLSANLTLIYQAMERQGNADAVFIAIPRPKRRADGNYRSLQKLVKKLGLGLIAVAVDSAVPRAEIIVFPVDSVKKPTKKNAAIKKEALSRTADTLGGTTKTKVNTAYREFCIHIAATLMQHGALSAKQLSALGVEGKVYNALYANYFGWFERAGKGVYGLTSVGVKYLVDNDSEPLVAYYNMKARECAV